MGDDEKDWSLNSKSLIGGRSQVGGVSAIWKHLIGALVTDLVLVLHFLFGVFLNFHDGWETVLLARC